MNASALFRNYYRDHDSGVVWVPMPNPAEAAGAYQTGVLGWSSGALFVQMSARQLLQAYRLTYPSI